MFFGIKDRHDVASTSTGDDYHACFIVKKWGTSHKERGLY